VEEKLAQIDRLGTEYLWNTYPRGWGHAGNTPHKWYKAHTHGGGVRDPLIVHWPARIREGGQVSPQFCHCADIVPTVLEVLGIEAPKVVNGFEQMPIHGTSLAYTFDEPFAPGRKRVQYFELMGNRGIWKDGWKAVTKHFRDTDFDQDRWELYHLDSDFSESEDLAGKHPDKLQELVALWHEEAERNHVYPLDDRAGARMVETYWGPPRRRWVYEAGTSRVTGYAGPAVGNRSYTIVADVDLQHGAEGVILAAGGRAGGYVLYVKDRRLVHEYVGPSRRWILESGEFLTEGRHRVAFEFRKQGHCAGLGTLLCDDREIGSIEMSDMWPLSPMGGGLYCGYDDAGPCSEQYTPPFRFTGTIHSVVIESGDDVLVNRSLEAHMTLSED
jgi:arylsulfatase